MQGKNGLKLGASGPLPGMTFFVFDHKVDDRRKWALTNWTFVEDDSIGDKMFDWAVGPGLTIALDYIATKSPDQYDPETCDEMEQFWLGFEAILIKLRQNLFLDRLRNLKGKMNVTIYDILLRHIGICEAEGALVAAIRVLSRLLKRSPKAIWDFIGDAKPNVIADIIISNKLYVHLLQQALDNAWVSLQPADSTPIATSWILPWLDSLSKDRKYDACETLLHTLFDRFSVNPELGEPARAACVRAGLDALTHTVLTFVNVESASAIGSTTHLYANMTVDLVTKYKTIILDNVSEPRNKGSTEGWTTFKVADAVASVVLAAMSLDQKLYYEERQTVRTSTISHVQFRKSNDFWSMVMEMYDSSRDQVPIARDVLSSLQPLVSVEQIRAKKSGETLSKCAVAFNAMLKETADTIAMIIGRIGDLDVTELGSVFADRKPIKVTIGLSVHDEPDLANSSVQVLKAWTGEDDKTDAFQQLSQLHAEQTLSSIVATLEQLSRGSMPWGPIRPLITMIRAVLSGLVDPTSGVLRGEALNPKLVAILIRWWSDLWRFVSRCCAEIEPWSRYISNTIMTEFCREIMELAEAIIAEDGLFASAIAMKKDQAESMKRLLEPAKDNFRGMENMIRLKDLWLVDVTVRVLCKILTRLRQNGLQINEQSKQFIIDASAPNASGKYAKTTNLKDQQRAELLEALGHKLEDIKPAQTIQVAYSADGTKKQSRLDAWSKSASSSSASSTKPQRSNRDDVLALSKSLENPLLKQLEARQKTKSGPTVPDLKAISALKESRQRAKLEKAKRDAEAIAKAKQLRGESGDGLVTKDQTRSEIMVNSSDEESDDGESDDGDNGYQLAALSTGGQKSVDEAERRRLQALRDLTRRPVKKQRLQRSAKEMRARLIPPMDKLHNTILAWDIFHSGNEPPNGPMAVEVATKYRDPFSYRDTFFPLLASEAWRAFVTAKDEVTSQTFGMKIASRASVDSYLEITFTMEISQHRERGASEGDILLVSEAENPLNDKRARHCLGRVQKITYKKEMVETMYRVASRNNPLVACLSPGSTVYGVKITNMTTIEREYAALESLQFYDLMDEILKGRPSPMLTYGPEKLANYQQNWALNKGQALAVLGAQDNDGFTLIQGPPGTGKTKTIVAMVGALLSEQLAQAPPSTAVAIRPGVPNGVPHKPPPGKKLLVCAPSNAAVDELVTRLKNGIITTSGRLKKINVLRLGRTDAISAAVKDVTLDELVRIRMEGDTTRDKAKADRDKMHEEAAKVKEELALLRPKLEEAKGSGDDNAYKSLSRKFDLLKRQQMDVGRRIDADKESGTSVAREVELKRRQIQQEILNSAQVLCATLSGSGHEMFRNLEVEFETVIIDEAAQCVELSALIPLKYGCCKCILVGDPKQLPPTVLSQSAAKFGYDQSLFVRMQQNHPDHVHLLDMQYRMHPEISKFPSKEFYEGQLRDGQDMARLRRQPWHRSVLLGPYRFFDVEGVQEKGRKGQSLVNTKELDVALQMYDRFSREYVRCDLAGKIGIITPYKAQLFELRNRFKARFGEGITDIIEFNTTDAFQGRECEIIIFSCVRASSTGGIGFMTDIRRMNVGLTRAKSSLWILGDSRALVQGEFWRKLIEDAKQRDRYTNGDVLSMFRKPLAINHSIEASPSPPLEPKEHNDPKDIEMRDAPPANNRDIKREPQEFAFNEDSLKNMVVPRLPNHPIIHTGGIQKPSDGKKRPLSSPDTAQPVIKKVSELNSMTQRPTGVCLTRF